MTGRVLTLASASPRRRQLLEMLGIPVVVKPSHIPEIHRPGEAPGAYAARLAREKASNVAGEWVLGADTTVVLDRELLEKPMDDEDAVRMLSLLQGRTHEVVTAVALIAGGAVRERIDVTEVTFRPMTEALLRAYVATGEPMDKAGAYAVQGLASRFVTRVEGSYSNVVGLPIALVYQMLTTKLLTF